MRSTLLTLAALLLPSTAPAATIILNLTGTAGNTTTNTFTSEGSTYNTGQLFLDSFAPFTVAEGDTIDATISLVGAFVVPASPEQLFGINFFQGDFGNPPGYPDNMGPMNTGHLTFSLGGGPTGRSSDETDGACSNCLTSITGQIPGAQFQFDSVRLVEQVTSLNAPFSIDNATLNYQLRDLASVTGAVPEPATWAMMILGFGVAGAAMRRRRALRLRFA